MKQALVSSLGLAALTGCALVTPALADVVSIDYVRVGDPGNPADATGYGSVGYAYNIGKYEVTNSQYAAFLNAKGQSNDYGIYYPNMPGIIQSGISGSFRYTVTPGMENKPVVRVWWYNAARFINWLGNGQGNADMENGAYTLNGATNDIGMVTKNAGAKVWIPSEDEWYKVEYYNSSTSTYSLYPNGQNTITTADANYNNGVGASKAVGSYSGVPSSYGTFDQGGNVWEWNDAVISGSSRGLRGGSWSTSESYVASSRRSSSPPNYAFIDVGFRVASVTAYESWKATAFANQADRDNPAVSGPNASPAGDGITNLMKYALALNPLMYGTSDLPEPAVQAGYLTLTYRKNKQAKDVTYTVEACDSLDGNWSVTSTVVTQVDIGGYWEVTVRDTVPIAGSPRRFMRLKVSH